jgi:hypothetical protein
VCPNPKDFCGNVSRVSKEIGFFPGYFQVKSCGFVGARMDSPQKV